MHNKIMETSVRLDGEMVRLNAILNNVEEIEDKDFLDFILEDLEKALEAVKSAHGTIKWAIKCCDT